MKFGFQFQLFKYVGETNIAKRKYRQYLKRLARRLHLMQRTKHWASIVRIYVPNVYETRPYRLSQE